MGSITGVHRKKNLLQCFIETDGHLSFFLNVKSVVLSSFVLIFEWHVGYTNPFSGYTMGYTNPFSGYTNGSFGLHKSIFLVTQMGLSGYTKRVFGLHKIKL